MSLAVIDHWIGKALFIPLIIKFCLLTGQSQFVASRLLRFTVTLR